jgi:hypothetical protein
MKITVRSHIRRTKNGTVKVRQHVRDCKTKNFSSMEAYRKNEAYQHIHNVNPEHPPYSKIMIKGKPHKVQHD